MTEPLEQMMRRLRAEYLDVVPERLRELRAALRATMDTGHADPSLATLFHRLAGSAGAYGFSEVSSECREMERFLREDPPRNALTEAAVAAGIDAIERAFGRGPTV